MKMTRKESLIIGRIIADRWYRYSYDIIKDEQIAQKKTESSSQETVNELAKYSTKKYNTKVRSMQ